MQSYMKKFLLLFTLAVTVSCSAWAQQGWKFGIMAIPQNTWLINKNDWQAAKDVYNHRVTFGMAAGPVVGYNFTDNFGFRMNFVYSLQGQRWQNRNADKELVTHKTRLHYGKFPLLVGFNTNTEHAKVIFTMYAGFQANLLLKVQQMDDDQSYVPDPGFDGSVLDYPTPWQQYAVLDYGPLMDIGFDVKITYNMMANIHLRAEYGLADAERKSATILNIEDGVPFNTSFYPDDRPKSWNFVAGLKIGLTYTLTSR